MAHAFSLPGCCSVLGSMFFSYIHVQFLLCVFFDCVFFMCPVLLSFGVLFFVCFFSVPALKFLLDLCFFSVYMWYSLIQPQEDIGYYKATTKGLEAAPIIV